MKLHILKLKNFITTALLVFLWNTKAFAQACSWSDCPASSMSDITAAFATEGYWLLADVVYQIGSTNLGLWAPLIYIMAYAAAGIMYAMGQPPKNWIWLILGPVIYNWLVFTTPDNPVKGVGWRVVNQGVDQSIVWRKSEVGLLNTNQIANPSNNSAPSNSVELPLLFLWVDELVSSTVQHLAAWSGVFRKLQNGGGSTYTHKQPDFSDSIADGEESLAWMVLSQSKWPMLENITQAKLVNHNTREAFIGFLSSECGDIFFKKLDKALYISAANAPGGKIPKSVFGEGKHKEIIELLHKESTPVPSAVRELLLDEGVGAGGGQSGDTFKKFIGKDVIKQSDIPKFKVVRCDDFFALIAQAFRWEAGHIYNQIIRQVGGEYKITKDEINYDFLYGWAVETEGAGGARSTVNLSIKEQENFIINLILMHLLRNEFAFAPGQINKRWTQTEMNIDFAENYQKTIGSKTKFGEMYTWTKLMPYIQGVLLYFLSAAYPFACMLMVVPGWHKTLFTWIGFFAWAKSWDIGFAMIGQLEKSIWAMLSNSDNDALVNGRIHLVEKLNELEVKCGAGGDDKLGCPDPTVTDKSTPDFAEMLEIFDHGLLLSNNLDMDIQNSYYIYLMSALYFGVPVATGQLFLGARASSASMVNNMASPAQQDGGRGTQTGFQSDNAAKWNANEGTRTQAVFAKGLRRSGFGLKSLQDKNDSMSSGLVGDIESTRGNLLGMRNQNIEAMGKDHGDAANLYMTGIGSTWQNNFGGPQGRPGILRTGGGYRGNKKNNNGSSGAAGMEPGAVGNGVGKKFLSNLFGKGAAVASMGGPVFDAMVGVTGPTFQSAVNLENGRMVNRATGANRVLQGDSAFKGFDFGAQSKAQGENAQRYDALANHQAQEDVWNDTQDMTAGGGFAGNVSIATGMSPGSISAPAQRSTNLVGMAGVGEGFLGEDAKSAFGYSDKGGAYYSQLKAGKQSLSGLTGQKALGFQEVDFAQMPASTLRSFYATGRGAVSQVKSAVDKGNIGHLTRKTPMEQLGGSSYIDSVMQDHSYDHDNNPNTAPKVQKQMTAGSILSGLAEIGVEKPQNPQNGGNGQGGGQNQGGQGGGQNQGGQGGN